MATYRARTATHSRGGGGLWRWVAVLAACAAACSALPRRAAPGPVGPRGLGEGLAAGDRSYRLPGEAVPLHYDVTIIPYLDQASFAFEGTVNIAIKAKKASAKLTLHADQLVVAGCSLDGAAARLSTDALRQFLVLDLAGKGLEAGVEYSLSCSFSGALSDDDKGFYRTSYYDEADDRGQWMAMTQFAPTFARRAFPCFDEPRYRATFTLSLVHDVDVSVAANTRPATISQSGQNRVTTTFETTPAMSAFSLAWLASRMPAAVSQDGDVRTWTRPAAAARTPLAQGVAPRALRAVADYTGIAYAIDKVDQVAVPTHLLGATANWGLATYREALLLADSQSRSSATLRATATVARQMAQQWFGGLVTPNWWCHLWMSEGFGVLLSYLTVHQLQPDWSVLDKLPVLETHAAFLEDALDTVQPMSYEEVYSPEEILARFESSISSKKGASVLRMLRDTVGDSTFQKGVQYYLEDRQPSGLVWMHNLWIALNKAIKEDGALGPTVDFTSLAASWTNQPGFPLVSVSRTGGAATATQARFLPAGPASSSSDDAALWHVPLTWRAEGGSVQRSLAFNETSLALEGVPAAARWVLVNADQIGYYRVNYDRANWLALSAALSAGPDVLSTAERAMLVDDALVLARAGLTDYDTALTLVEALAAEKAFAPWAAFANNADFLAMQCRAVDDDARTFDAWMGRLSHDRALQLGFKAAPGEPFEDKLTRGVAVRLSLESGDPATVNAAVFAYLDWSSGKSLEPDTARLAFCQDLKTSQTFAPLVDLLSRLEDSEDEAEREDLTYAIGCAPENDIVQLKSALLQWLLAGEGMLARDERALWAALVADQAGVRATLDYATANAKDIVSQYGVDKLKAAVAALGSRIVLQADYDKLNAFAAGDGASITGLPDTLATSLALASANLAWRSKHYEAVMDYLRSAVPTMEPPAPTDPATRTPATQSTLFTLPPTGSSTAASLPTLPPTGPSTQTTPDPTASPTDPGPLTAPTATTFFTLPPSAVTTPVTLPPLPTSTARPPTRPPTAPTAPPTTAKPSAGVTARASGALLLLVWLASRLTL